MSLRCSAVVCALVTSVLVGWATCPAAAQTQRAGGLIAYTMGGGEDPYLLKTMRPDGTHARTLIRPRRKKFPLGAEFPQWSANGKRILFGGHHHLDSRAQSLWYANSRGKHVTRIPLAFLGGTGTGPRALSLFGWDWAPSGRRVVVAAGRRGSPDSAVMYTVSLDGRDHRRLRRGFWPEWSGDGRHIVFELGDFGDSFLGRCFSHGEARIAVVRRNGAGFRYLTGSDQDACPSFSPDGRHVVFSRGGGLVSAEWRTVDLTGRNETLVMPKYRHPYGYEPLHYTPDGTRFAANRLEPSGQPDVEICKLVTIRTDGSDETVVGTYPDEFVEFFTFDFDWQPR
jgi:hypothetical protein